MLIHLRPRCFSPFEEVQLVELRIDALNLTLAGGTDLTTGRPYPNKRYAVGCRKIGRKALDGILIETPGRLRSFVAVYRWAINAEHVAEHHVEYSVLDEEYDAVTENMVMWAGASEALGGWSNRWPEGLSGSPASMQPTMEVLRTREKSIRELQDTCNGHGLIARRTERFSMPTVEPERIVTSVWDRTPTMDHALRLT